MTARDLEQLLVDSAVAEYVKTPEGEEPQRLHLEAVRREREETECVLEAEALERQVGGLKTPRRVARSPSQPR